MPDFLNWELATLSKAVSYPNLSSAAPHVGLSQSQLSRIVIKLEEQYQIRLLDRDIKRKSVWLPDAKQLVAAYLQASKSFSMSVANLSGDQDPDTLSIGALDGLIQQALSLAHFLFSQTKVRLIEVKALDLGDLDELFLKAEIDFAFSSREPGMKKLKNSKLIGYQSIDLMRVDAPSLRNPEPPIVLSPFELNARKSKLKGTERIFTSHSLTVRSKWVETFGGSATQPSPMYSKRKNIGTERPVLLIAQQNISPRLWKSALQVW